VLLQIDEAIAIDPEHLTDVVFGQAGDRNLVVRAFDDDLVRAHAMHLVVDAVAALIEVPFDLERRELVGDHAHPPTTLIGAGMPFAVGQNLVRRLVLVPFAKRAKRAAQGLRFRLGHHGTLGAFGRDDHPATDNRIFPQLWHSWTSLGYFRRIRLYVP